MRKILVSMTIVVWGFTVANAQGLKAGMNLGYPFGDAGENFSFQAGIDVSYTFALGESFEIGGTTGIGHFFGKEMETENLGQGQSVTGPSFTYLPMAATGKYGFGSRKIIFASVSLGYAVAIGDEETHELGGLLYDVKVGWQNDMMEFFIYYRGIGASESESSTSGNVTVTTTTQSMSLVGLGTAYKF